MLDVQLELQRPGGAKSSGPTGVPSGLVPNRRRATTSAGSTARSGTVSTMGPGTRARVTATGSRLRQRRRRPQHDARVAPDHHRRAGARVQRVEGQVHGPGRGRLRAGRRGCRARPDEAPVQRVDVAVRRLHAQRRVVEHQRVLVARPPAARSPRAKNQLGQVTSVFISASQSLRALRNRCRRVGSGRRELLPAADHVGVRIARARCD